MKFTLKNLNALKPYFCDNVPEIMSARYVQLVILRQLEAHAIFTTEGDELVIRKVQAGIQNKELVSRLMMSNRKVIAPERRLGKETLRTLGILSDKAGQACYLGKLCGKCLDCILCGFAALKGLGNNNSRVLTDEAWSLDSVKLGQNVENMTFNAINERSRGTGQSLGDTDQIVPEALFVNVTTLKSVTLSELLYWIYCTHFTRRYGADSSRIGKMRNHIVGIVGSYVEALSSLDLTKRFYDACGSTSDITTLKEKGDSIVREALDDLGIKQYLFLDSKRTIQLLNDFWSKYTDENNLKSWLKKANEDAGKYATKVKGKAVKEEEEGTEEETEIEK